MRSNTAGLALFLVALLCAPLASADWEPVAPGIHYQHFSDSTLSIHVARIDLTNDDLRIVSTRQSRESYSVKNTSSPRSSVRMKSKTPACSSQSIRPSAARWMKHTVAFRFEDFHLFCSTGFARTLCKSSLWHTSASVLGIGVVAGDC